MWTGRKISHTDPSNEAHKKPGMSLEETIRPLWKFTCYAGFFPEWCTGMKKRGKFSTVVLYFSISFSLLSSVFMSLFQLYQSAIGIFYKNTTSSIVLNLLLTFLYLLAPLVQLNVLFNRNQYLSFFQQWKAFEQHVLKYGVTNAIKRLARCFYGIFILMSSSSIIGTIIWLLIQKEATSIFLTYYPAVTEKLTLSFVTFIHAVCSSTMISMFLFVNILPSFTYYHASCATKALELEIKQIFFRLQGRSLKFKSVIDCTYRCDVKTAFCFEIRNCWLHYETLKNLVSCANHLFGVIMIANQTVIFLQISILIFSFLSNLQGPIFETCIYFVVVVNSVFCLMFCNLMASTLYTSHINLRDSIHVLMSRAWNILNKEELQTITTFTNRIQHSDLVASPRSLYNITPSILLTMSSIVVSNTIVLMQSK